MASFSPSNSRGDVPFKVGPLFGSLGEYLLPQKGHKAINHLPLSKGNNCSNNKDNC